MPKATGPVSADHVAVLQRQRQRLVCAVRRMAAVIHDLQAEKGFDGENAMPLPAKSGHAQSEDTDITEILNQYAPEPAPTPEKDRSTAAYTYKPKKRPREDDDHSDTTIPQADDHEHCADDSGGSGSINDAAFFDVDLAATVAQDPIAPESTAHLPFMRMLHNSNMPGLMTDGAGTKSLQTLESGAPEQPFAYDIPSDANDIPAMHDEGTALGTSIAAPAAPWDASLASLFEMVDWDASLESCWGTFANEPPPLGNGGWIEDEPMF